MADAAASPLMLRRPAPPPRRLVRVLRVEPCDGRDHRDEAAVGEPVARLAVDAGDLSDEAEVRASTVREEELLPDDEGAPAAVQGDRLAARDPDELADPRADFVYEHARDDLHRLRRGHALALDELRLDARALHLLGDARAPAVHEHRPHADLLHEDDVGEHRAERLLVSHRAPAELDDDELAAKGLDVRQRLDEHARLFDRLPHVFLPAGLVCST